MASYTFILHEMVKTDNHSVWCSALPPHWRANKSLPTSFKVVCFDKDIEDGTLVKVTAGNEFQLCSEVKNCTAKMHNGVAKFDDLRFSGRSGRGKTFSVVITIFSKPPIVATLSDAIKVTVDGPRESRKKTNHQNGYPTYHHPESLKYYTRCGANNYYHPTGYLPHFGGDARFTPIYHRFSPYNQPTKPLALGQMRNLPYYESYHQVFTKHPDFTPLNVDTRIGYPELIIDPKVKNRRPTDTCDSWTLKTKSNSDHTPLDIPVVSSERPLWRPYSMDDYKVS